MYYSVLQGTTRYYEVLQSTTKYHNILPGTMMYYNALQHTTRYYDVLHKYNPHKAGAEVALALRTAIHRELHALQVPSLPHKLTIEQCAKIP